MLSLPYLNNWSCILDINKYITISIRTLNNNNKIKLNIIDQPLQQFVFNFMLRNVFNITLVQKCESRLALVSFLTLKLQKKSSVFLTNVCQSAMVYRSQIFLPYSGVYVYLLVKVQRKLFYNDGCSLVL